MAPASDWVTPRTTEVASADGRRLRVQVAGDLRRPVVVQVGSPNAGVLYEGWIRDAAAKGLSLIAYDRPGYGGSTPNPGRSISDTATDVAAVGDALGFDRCAVWGFSGGGPHALACGALLSPLVRAVAAIGSPAPRNAEGLDFFEGMSLVVRQDIELFESDRAEWERGNQEQCRALLGMSVDELSEQWSAGAALVDRNVLHGEFGTWLYRAVRAALAQGVEGWTEDDIAIFHAKWGFDPVSITVPVKLWHGGQDRFIPFDHGRWLADVIPNAERELRNDDGHLNVVAHRINEVHRWLANFV